jgi:hypothetical protein
MTTSVLVPDIQDVKPLTAHDRCDACGHQAYVLVVLAAAPESPLLFCNHHFARHSAELELAAIRIEEHPLDTTSTP